MTIAVKRLTWAVSVISYYAELIICLVGKETVKDVVGTCISSLC